MYRTKLLVVANQTVDSDELYHDLQNRAERGPISVTFLVPQDSPGGMGTRVRRAVQRLHADGIDAEAMLGDVDPACAVIEVWDPRRWDEVIVATFPTAVSRWLRIDVPHRIRRTIDAPVSTIQSRVRERDDVHVHA
jgi:hypothetical protein